MPPNVTAVAPVNAVPVIVTLVPTAPLVGVKLVIVGAVVPLVVTVNVAVLVAVPPLVVTLIVPVVAPVGTVAVICVLELTVNDALVPLKVTEDTDTKFVPVSVTAVPTGPPADGLKLVNVGGGVVPPPLPTSVVSKTPTSGVPRPVTSS